MLILAWIVLLVAIVYLGVKHKALVVAVRLTKCELETLMSDVETLNETLAAINDRVSAVTEDVQTLKDQLEEIHQGGAVDLTDSLELAEGILSRLTTLDESVPATEEEAEQPVDPVDPDDDLDPDSPDEPGTGLDENGDPI